MKQTSNLLFSSFLDEYVNTEKRLISYTRKHPLVMLAAATGLGFALGYFGALRVLQAGVSLGLKENVLLKDFFEPGNPNLSMPQEIEEPHAQA